MYVHVPAAMLIETSIISITWYRNTLQFVSICKECIVAQVVGAFRPHYSATSTMLMVGCFWCLKIDIPLFVCCSWLVLHGILSAPNLFYNSNLIGINARRIGNGVSNLLVYPGVKRKPMSDFSEKQRDPINPFLGGDQSPLSWKNICSSRIFETIT